MQSIYQTCDDGWTGKVNHTASYLCHTGVKQGQIKIKLSSGTRN